MLCRISYSVKLMFRYNYNSESLKHEGTQNMDSMIPSTNQTNDNFMVKVQYSVPEDNEQRSTNF